MAVTKLFVSKSLNLIYPNGEDKTKTRSYANVRASAPADAVFAVGKTISDMSDTPARNIMETEKNELLEEESLTFKEKQSIADYQAYCDKKNAKFDPEVKYAAHKVDRSTFKNFVRDAKYFEEYFKAQKDIDVHEFNDIVETKDLKIIFTIADGSTSTLTVYNYKRDATEEDFREGGAAILAENVFAPGGLSMIGIKEFKKVDQTVNTFAFEE